MNIIRNYHIQTVTLSRRKRFQIVTLQNGQIWINLNDLCLTCVTTATSVINSLGKNSKYIRYYKSRNNTDPQDKGIAFISADGVHQAPLFHSNTYKTELIDWIEAELQKPVLPTPEQIFILDNDPHSQNFELATLSTHDFLDTVNEANNIQEPVCFVPYPDDCNITRLNERFRDFGLNLTEDIIMQWLIKHKYCSSAKSHKYRPHDAWYNAGYFKDNRKMFNSAYPIRDLIFTPLGQAYFYSKISQDLAKNQK